MGKTYVEFNDSQSVVSVIMFAEIRLDGGNSDSSHTLNLAVLTEEPKS